MKALDRDQHSVCKVEGHRKPDDFDNNPNRLCGLLASPIMCYLHPWTENQEEKSVDEEGEKKKGDSLPCAGGADILAVNEEFCKFVERKVIELIALIRSDLTRSS